MEVKEGLEKLKEDLKLNDIVCLDDFINSNEVNLDNKNKEYILIEDFKNNIESNPNFDNYDILSYRELAKEQVHINNSITYKERLNGIKNKYFLVDKSIKIEFIVDLFEFLDSFFNDNITEALQNIIDHTGSTNREDISNIFIKFENQMRSILFRGQASMNFFVIPSIYRNSNLLKNEDKMYNNLISEFPQEFSSPKRHIDILKKFQHYNMPTRLLDLTSNLLVALYFAVSQEDTYDAELLIFQESNTKNNNSDNVEILSAISTQSLCRKKELYEVSQKYQKKIKNNEKLKENIIEQYNNERIVKFLLHEIQRVVGKFEPVINPNDLFKTLFVSTYLDNPRILDKMDRFLLLDCKILIVIIKWIL